MRVKGTMMNRGLCARPKHTTSPGKESALVEFGVHNRSPSPDPSRAARRDFSSSNIRCIDNCQTPTIDCSHVRLLWFTVRPHGVSASQAQSYHSRSRWKHNWTFRKAKSIESMPMLSSTKSSVQRHRTWRTLHELPIGRSRMHRL